MIRNHFRLQMTYMVSHSMPLRYEHGV